MEPQAAPKPRTGRRVFYGWVIVGVAFAAVFSEATTRNFLLSVFIIPVSKEFGWSRTVFTGAIAIGSALSSLIAPVVGPIIDRRGAKEVVVAGVAITSGAFMGLAFVRSLWQFYVLLILARAVSSSMVLMGAMVVVANWFVRRRGRAIAISRSGTWVAIPLFIFMAQLISDASGWRVSWFIMGAVTLVLAVPPALIFMKRRPEDVGLLPDGDAPQDPASAATPAQRARPVTEVSWSVREAVRTRALWLIILATGLAGMVVQGINLHALASMVDRGVPGATAAGATSFALIASGGGTLAWGFVFERAGARYSAVMIYLGTAAGIVALMLVNNASMAYVFALVYGFCFGGFRILEHILYADYFGREHLGTITGFTRPFHLVTSAAGPLLASLAYDLRGSYTLAFAVFLASFLVAAALMVLATPPRKPGRSPGPDAGFGLSPDSPPLSKIA